MDRKLFLDLLTQPSAPFREKRVMAKASEALASIPHFHDTHGNLIIGAGSEEEYARKVALASGKDPLRVFMAHTDHPGFHGVSWKKPGLLEARWFGGAPVKGLKGCKVWLANSEGYRAFGKIQKAQVKDGRIQSLFISTEKELGNAKDLFGAFAFKAPVWKVGKRYYTKAADDLVGSFCIVQVAKELWAKSDSEEQARFLGVLTRAEEVGFVGAIGHLELGWLAKAARDSILLVSLETSRMLPGAKSGLGPIVRLGDRATPFSAGPLQILERVAKETLKMKYQKRIMDGGSCEGTAGMALNYPTIALSVPLGNYHNQNFEGGPGARIKNGPAPEFVDESDVEGLIAICKALLKADLGWEDPWKPKKDQLRSTWEKYQGLL